MQAMSKEMKQCIEECLSCYSVCLSAGQWDIAWKLEANTQRSVISR